MFLKALHLKPGDSGRALAEAEERKPQTLLDPEVGSEMLAQ